MQLLDWNKVQKTCTHAHTHMDFDNPNLFEVMINGYPH